MELGLRLLPGSKGAGGGGKRAAMVALALEWKRDKQSGVVLTSALEDQAWGCTGQHVASCGSTYGTPSPGTGVVPLCCALESGCEVLP